MKRVVFCAILAFGVTISSVTLSYAGGTCTGSDNCSACKNCTGCKHCSKDGGSCGVCKKSDS